MKLKTSFRLLFFLSTAFLFFIHANIVLAIEGFDLTQNYTVHSVPVLSGESQVSIHSENESKAEQTQQPTTPFQTAKETQAEPSFSEKINNFSTSISETIKLTGQNALTSVTQFVQNRWSGWLIEFAIFSGVSALSFFLFNTSIATALTKRVLKSATDSQIRLAGIISALFLSATSGVALITVYNQQLSFFEQYTHWQFNPLAEDLMLMGSILLIGVIFLEGGAILAGAKSLTTAGFGLAPSGKKIINYFVKETKTAFTETDKECDDQIENCSSLFDKTVILLFNYLPGNMPDLGMDDAIINFKNSLFKTPQPQKAK